jgi:hypothetical protein
MFMAVTMKNVIFWDVTPCGSCKNLQKLHGITSQMTFFMALELFLMFKFLSLGHAIHLSMSENLTGVL